MITTRLAILLVVVVIASLRQPQAAPAAPRLNQIPSQNVRGAYNKVRVSSGQCEVLDK
jgi:hypothetical protein